MGRHGQDGQDGRGTRGPEGLRAASNVAPSRRDRMLAYAGPVIVLSVLAVWVVLLMLGAALVIHPHLGTGVTSSSGPTKTDYMTAFYAAGEADGISLCRPQPPQLV